MFHTLTHALEHYVDRIRFSIMLTKQANIAFLGPIQLLLTVMLIDFFQILL